MQSTYFVMASLLTTAPSASTSAIHVLKNHCKFWAAERKNPWALTHGIKLFGRKFLANDGRRAVDVIFRDFLRRNPTSTSTGVAVGTQFHFAPFSTLGTPIEPHLNLHLQTLVCDRRMPLSARVKTSWGSMKLKELLDDVKRGFRHVPASIEYWKKVGWTLDLFAMTQQPGIVWKIPTGGAISLDKIFDDALARLELENTQLKAGMDKNLPQVNKRKQGVYAYTCGALHFIQGVLVWARHPTVRKKWGDRFDKQVDILFYRLGSERRQYEMAYQQVLRTAPRYAVRILMQEVKFYGHFLETLGRLKRDVRWQPNARQRHAITQAKVLLDAAVKKLRASKHFQKMKLYKKSRPQLYLDLIGDVCHAAHGLQAWK